MALGLRDVVRGVHHGRAAARASAADELPQALALARVERGRRLVEQQQPRLGEQADGDVDPLPVAARERPDRVVGPVAQAGLVEHPADGGVDVRDLLEPGEQPQVLRDRELRVDRRLLRDPADLAAVERHVPDVGSSAPARICSSVVLPAPFGPMTATSSPGAASNETPWSARRAP